MIRKNLPQEEIIKLYEINKESCRAIALKYDCNGATIRNILKDNNIKRRSGGEQFLGTKKSEEFKKFCSERMMGEKKSSIWKTSCPSNDR